MSNALQQALRDQTAKIANHGENLLRAYHPHDLHQLRVNIRRTRSLLKRVQTGPARFFRKSWGAMFAVTGRARDLDVFMITVSESMPPDLAGALEDVLRLQLEESHEAVDELLRSGDWRRHWGGWRGYLVTQENREGGIPHESLRSVENGARKACRRALENGTDRNWHRFRIAIKNLRYVADASRDEPGSDAAALDTLIDECKLLQTLLGDWHDTIVQLALLKEPWASEPGARKAAAELEGLVRARKRDLVEQVRAAVTERDLFRA